MRSGRLCGRASWSAVSCAHIACMGADMASWAAQRLDHMVSPPTSGLFTMCRIDMSAGRSWKVMSVCHSSATPPPEARSSKIFGCGVS